MENNIYVAKLGKTVGLKGNLKLHIQTDFPEQFKKDIVFKTNKNLSLKLKEFNPNKNLILFENYENIDLAKKLINQELYVTIEQSRQSCILKENEFFWFDLMSCELIENDIILGKVKEVHRYPSSDYLELSTARNLIEEKQLPKTFLLPFIFDKYILKVDIQKKQIFAIKAYDVLENS